MKTYNVVLIGCGHIGLEHISDIHYRENIKIRAVIDTDMDKALNFKHRFGAEFADTDYLPYIKDELTDIVIIASPVSCHLPMLTECLKYKKHVLCEKPIAANIEDGKEFFELCKNAETCVSVGHILRHNDTFIKVRELIRAGAIGKLRLARMVQNHHIINVERYHSLLRECSPLVDCGVHYFDLLQWICGCKITEVSGMGTKIEQDFNDISIDYGIANVRLEDGTIGYYEAGWNRGISSNNTKEFIGEKGSISVTLNQFRSSHTEEGDLIELYNNENGSYTAINIPCSYKPMYRQLSSLIDKIEGRETQAPTIEEAYSAFLVAVAADKAAREGIKVKI